MTSSANSNGSDAPITVDVIFPNVAAMFAALTTLPWFHGYSVDHQKAMKFAFYCAANETLRLVTHRLNADQNALVFEELQRELSQYEMLEAFPRTVGTIN